MTALVIWALLFVAACAFLYIVASAPDYQDKPAARDDLVGPFDD